MSWTRDVHGGRTHMLVMVWWEGKTEWETGKRNMGGCLRSQQLHVMLHVFPLLLRVRVCPRAQPAEPVHLGSGQQRTVKIILIHCF